MPTPARPSRRANCGNWSPGAAAGDLSDNSSFDSIRWQSELPLDVTLDLSASFGELEEPVLNVVQHPPPRPVNDSVVMCSSASAHMHQGLERDGLLQDSLDSLSVGEAGADTIVQGRHPAHPLRPGAPAEPVYNCNAACDYLEACGPVATSAVLLSQSVVGTAQRACQTVCPAVAATATDITATVVPLGVRASSASGRTNTCPGSGAVGASRSPPPESTSAASPGLSKSALLAALPLSDQATSSTQPGVHTRSPVPAPLLMSCGPPPLPVEVNASIAWMPVSSDRVAAAVHRIAAAEQTVSKAVVFEQVRRRYMSEELANGMREDLFLPKGRMPRVFFEDTLCSGLEATQCSSEAAIGDRGQLAAVDGHLVMAANTSTSAATQHARHRSANAGPPPPAARCRLRPAPTRPHAAL